MALNRNGALASALAYLRAGAGVMEVRLELYNDTMDPTLTQRQRDDAIEALQEIRRLTAARSTDVGPEYQRFARAMGL